jgi:hypothetical protein
MGHHNSRWREVLEPLEQKFQQQNAGDLDHMDMDKAIHQTHIQTKVV